MMGPTSTARVRAPPMRFGVLQRSVVVILADGRIALQGASVDKRILPSSPSTPEICWSSPMLSSPGTAESRGAYFS